MDNSVAKSDLLSIQDSSNINELSSVTVALARRVLGCDGVTFVLREKDSSYYFDEDAIAPLWKGARFPLGSCISGWVINFREVCLIEDILLDERIPQDAYKPTFVKSLCMVPLGVANPIGAMGVYWKNQHLATKEEVAGLKQIADAAYLALKRLLSPIQSMEKGVVPQKYNLEILSGLSLMITTKEANAANSARLASYLSAHGASVLQMEIENKIEAKDLLNVEAIIWNHQHETEDCTWEKDIESFRSSVGGSPKFIHLLDGNCNYSSKKVDGVCIEDRLLERYLLTDLAVRILQLARS